MPGIGKHNLSEKISKQLKTRLVNNSIKKFDVVLLQLPLWAVGMPPLGLGLLKSFSFFDISNIQVKFLCASLLFWVFVDTTYC